MPANLGPEYLAAEAEYRRAETLPERIAALEKMYATLLLRTTISWTVF
jgi:hypothetical protein